MAAPIEQCEIPESSVIDQLMLTIKDCCKKKNIDCEKLNVCRQSRRLKNGDFIVPKGCISLSVKDISYLQDEIVQQSQELKLPIQKVCQADYHTLALFVARSKSFHILIREVLLKGVNYGKTDLCKNKTQVVVLNPSVVSATTRDSVVSDVSVINKGGETNIDDNHAEVIQRTYSTLKSASPVDCRTEISGTTKTINHVSSDDSNLKTAVQELSVDQTTIITACPAEYNTTRRDIIDSPGSLNTKDQDSTSDQNKMATEVPDHPDTFVEDSQSDNSACTWFPGQSTDVLASIECNYTQIATEGIRESDLAHSHHKHSPTSNTETATEVTSQMCLTPACLRAIALLQHVTELLKATGHQVMEVPVLPSAAVLELCHVLGYQPACSSTHTKTLDTLTHRAEVSPFRHTVNKGKVKQCGTEGCGDSTDDKKQSESIVMDLRKFMQEAGLIRGKKAYDKNLHYVDVKYVDGSTDILHQVAKLEDSVQKDILQDTSTDVTYVHFVSENSAFTQQQTDLVWRMLSSKHTPVNQSHLVIGSVICRKEAIGQWHVSAEDFIRLRFQQVKQLSDLKYGDELDSSWEATLMNLTAATVKFEMLNTACKNKLKLDVSQHADGGPGAETRAGLFVVYNCARLATLFSHFQQEVQKGMYPDLPSIDSVNFELLREEEEWILLFNYVSLFPEVVQSSVEDIGPHKTDIYAKIHTHKIANFLISLSRSLSSYYGRIHILGEGKPHLLPVMFARLYLMKAVHQVLMNGLLLLGIQPFSQI